MSSDQTVTETITAPVAVVPQPGSYGGTTSHPFTFHSVGLYVSSDSTHLQDVTLGGVALACTPSTPSPNSSPDQKFEIASIPINADGFFSTTTTETGVIGNALVHYTYTFTGQFTGTSRRHVPRGPHLRRNLHHLHVEHPYWSATQQ